MAINGWAAGFQGGWWSRLATFDSVPYPAGTAGSALAQGSISGAVFLPDVTTSDLATAEREVVNIQGGDDDSVAKFYFGKGKLNAFTFQDSRFNTSLIANISGTTLNTTELPGIEMYSTNPNSPLQAPSMMTFWQQFQSADGIDGVELYRHITIFNSKVSVSETAPTYRGAMNVTYNCAPNVSSHFLNGETLAALGMNLYDGKADHMGYISPYTMHVATYRSDGSDTSVTLPYLPVDEDFTFMFVNGAPVTPSAVNTTTGVVGFTATTADDIHVFFYGTDFSPSP